ncbi:MAG: hypothetical protein ACJ79B_06280, partial [Gemmatimonadaceae bacterium]
MMKLRVRSIAASLNKSTFICLCLAVSACSDGAGPVPLPPPANVHLIELETFDGSGQAVHPDA